MRAECRGALLIAQRHRWVRGHEPWGKGKKKKIQSKCTQPDSNIFLLTTSCPVVTVNHFEENLQEVLPLMSSMVKMQAPRRFSKLSWFSCFSSLSEWHCPSELVPAADLVRVPLPLLDGEDRSARRAGGTLLVLILQMKQPILEHVLMFYAS